MAQPTYILGDSGPVSDEVARLDFQHFSFFRKLAGDKLLPKHISEYLSTLTSPNVADVGTGTGAWLVDLARELPPTSNLYGFDIDTNKFAPADTLPSNVTLAAGNALEPPPEEHRGKYDVVHARLFIYALRKVDWEVMARNMFALLKPGGWILWEETGYPSWVALPPSKGFTDFLEVDIAFGNKVGRDITHPANLLKHVENAGFVDCDEKDHSNIDLFRTDSAKRVYLGLLTQAIRGMLMRGGVPGLETEEDAERLRKGLEGDIYDEERLCLMQFKWVWGRKAQ